MSLDIIPVKIVQENPQIAYGSCITTFTNGTQVHYIHPNSVEYRDMLISICGSYSMAYKRLCLLTKMKNYAKNKGLYLVSFEDVTKQGNSNRPGLYLLLTDKLSETTLYESNRISDTSHGSSI